jgi:hypothetical protein
MSTRETIQLGIVVERRKIDHPWQEYAWRPVAVIPGAGPMDPGEGMRLLQEGDDWSHFHIGTLLLKLYPDETDGYRTNLSRNVPCVYIVLSPGEEEDDPEVLPFLVTVCPDEAADYLEDSDQIVEGVAMPGEIAALVQEFVDKYHVEVPFKKRKRKPYDPRKGAFQREEERGSMPRSGRGRSDD